MRRPVDRPGMFILAPAFHAVNEFAPEGPPRRSAQREGGRTRRLHWRKKTVSKGAFNHPYRGLPVANGRLHPVFSPYRAGSTSSVREL